MRLLTVLALGVAATEGYGHDESCWTYKVGYYEASTHSTCSATTYADPDDAKTACEADATCGGVAKQSGLCDGKYRTNIVEGGEAWTFYGRWATYDLWAFDLDRSCLSPPSTPTCMAACQASQYSGLCSQSSCDDAGATCFGFGYCDTAPSWASNWCVTPCSNSAPKSGVNLGQQCEDLWAKSGASTTASVTLGGQKNQGVLNANALSPLLTVGKDYTMEFDATSTCDEEFVISMPGGGGWMHTPIFASWNPRKHYVTTDTCLKNTNLVMKTRTPFTATLKATTVWRNNGDRRLSEEEEEEARRELGDQSETTTYSLEFPRCDVTISNIKLWEADCFGGTEQPTNEPTAKPTNLAPTISVVPTSSPTPRPSQKPTAEPTKSTTTFVPPPLPPVPIRYFASLFDMLITPVIPAIKTEETPVQVRYTALFDTMTWECMAIYHPTWLDSLTKQRPFLEAPASMHNTDNRLQCAIAAAHHFTKIYLDSAHPGIESAVDSVSQGYLGYVIPLRDGIYTPIKDCGINPTRQRRGKLDAFMDWDSVSDQTCIRGAVAAASYATDIVGQAVAEHVMGYAATDGWNSLGNTDRDGSACTANQRPFRDTTGYEPYDCSDDPVADWTRWQPLEEDSGEGFYWKQEHVTPHIGTEAKTRVITDAQRLARVAPNPNYDYVAEANLVIQRVAALTDQKKVEVEWNDDKLNILLTTFGTLLNTGHFNTFEKGCAWLVGYTTMEYDSTIVVWKEKRAYDLIRPTTWIQENFKDDEFTTYAGPYEGTQSGIKGKDFEPYKRVMPHSEYPSGSACLCLGIQEFTDAFVQRTTGQTSIALQATFPAFTSSVEPGMTPAQDVVLTFPTMTAMAQTCSQSRLDGGMHFSASVPAAENLCAGIGTAGFVFASQLIGDAW